MSVTKKAAPKKAAAKKGTAKKATAKKTTARKATPKAGAYKKLKRLTKKTDEKMSGGAPKAGAHRKGKVHDERIPPPTSPFGHERGLAPAILLGDERGGQKPKRG